MPESCPLGSSEPLSSTYDVAMLDLDGVVYIGDEAIPGVAAHLAEATAAGLRIAFITNNASRPAPEIAERLVGLGVTATAEDVVTSAQAAARLLRSRFSAGARIAVVGGPGLEWAVAEAGLTAVAWDDSPEAVVTGYGPDLSWRQIMQGAVAIRNGVPWVASNTDATFPTSMGLAPGHGALVGLIARFAEVEPQVAGKPARPLLDETIRRVGARRPLMVGDRLDTDIEGGRNAGVDTLLVMTGVTGLVELADAAPEVRPTYLARDLGGLTLRHVAGRRVGDAWEVEGWSAEVRDDALRVDGEGGGDAWWRAAALALWAYRDENGCAADVSGTRVPELAQPTR